MLDDPVERVQDLLQYRPLLIFPQTYSTTGPFWANVDLAHPTHLAHEKTENQKVNVIHPKSDS